MLVTPLHVSAPTGSRGLKDQAEEKAESPQPAGFQLEEKARGNVQRRGASAEDFADDAEF